MIRLLELDSNISQLKIWNKIFEAVRYCRLHRLLREGDGAYPEVAGGGY